MGKNSAISWCDHTFNPWWGCTQIGGSPACGPAEGETGPVCYAKAWDARCGGDHWGADKERRFFGDKHWQEPLKWNREAEADGERRRVFIMSMGDWAEGRDDQRGHVGRLMAETIPGTPWLDKLMLTKRPQLIPRLYTLGPRPDVWMGVTVENQRWMDLRWPALREVEASIYWLSMEPLFERVTLPKDFLGLGKRAWAIVGGPSGHGAGQMQPDVPRYMRDQCVEAGVPFHFKQWGEYGPDSLVRIGKKAAGRMLDGRTWDQVPAFGAVRECVA